MELRGNIIHFFEEQLQDLDCHQDTRAYIVGVFGRYRTADFDLSKESITIYFSEARNRHDFSRYQACADWIFLCHTLMPTHLHYASKEYYDTIARLSYYSCYKILNKQWKTFEELADNFIVLENEVANKLRGTICF